MGIDVNAASNFARRLIEKYNLKPPIDIKSLLSRYAELVFSDIPFQGADGISVNLKVSGKTTRVIVNQNMPSIRQRFTMAHELGHVIIPWHTGTIIDHINHTEIEQTNYYWEIEAEANIFAAELLMPIGFIKCLLSKNQDLAEVNYLIAKICDVSLIASAIRMDNFSPKNIVYAYEKNGITEFSGRTKETIANKLKSDCQFPTNPFDYAKSHFTKALNSGNIHWWILPSEIHFEVNDIRSWRELLNAIIQDINIPASDVAKFKSSVNGVVAYANGVCKRNNTHSIDSVVSAGIQRFKDKSNYELFVEHKDFTSFLVKKARELVLKN